MGQYLGYILQNYLLTFSPPPSFEILRNVLDKRVLILLVTANSFHPEDGGHVIPKRLF
jgi:hypothetical protein